MQSVPQNIHCQMVGLVNQNKYEWSSQGVTFIQSQQLQGDWGKPVKFSERIEIESKFGALPLPLIWQIS